MKENKIFIENENILIQHNREGFSGTNDLIITDLNKISQVRISKGKGMNKFLFFAIDRVDIDRETNKKIIIRSYLREIVYTTKDIIHYGKDLAVSIKNIEQDSFYNIDETDKNTEIKNKIIVDLEKLVSIVKGFNVLNPIEEDIQYLKHQGITFENDNLEIQFDVKSSQGKAHFDINGKSIVHNVSWQKRDYDKKIQLKEE